MKTRIAIAVVAVVALAGAWAALRRGGVPAADGPVVEVVRFVGGGAYRTLPEGERRGYTKRLAEMSMEERQRAMGEAGLSEEQKERVLEVVYGEGQPGPVEEYARLKTAKEKRAYLDRMVRAGGVSVKGEADGEVWSSEGRRRFLEGTSALERAQLAEFVGALNRKRREMGLAPEVPGR